MVLDENFNDYIDENELKQMFNFDRKRFDGLVIGNLIQSYNCGGGNRYLLVDILKYFKIKKEFKGRVRLVRF